ncbi:hypothetical protein FisN_13Hu157 [Fistulifera solaris]|uniref:Uncharacterized protein n=1 Tax=Fistulifera solaris TaxID=1519565 RepID=A0A1Z5KN34_FISSO|nr:hypothetical protein FisN_13Hu157 [Fistulifera solaris]|eukprot:GAX27743.1 hypothetical protein FisN_13Hu157 [Fistulifera solaris]
MYRTEMRRLLKLEVFEKLTLCVLDELTIPAFSARAKALDHSIDAQYVMPSHFKSLRIVTKDLHLKIHFGEDRTWVSILISFLKRVAKLGHFEKFGLSLIDFCRWADCDALARITQAFIDALNGNSELIHLDISGAQFLFDHSAVHFGDVFRALEEHGGLRTVILGDYPPENNPDDYSLLERLLSRNRRITVYDYLGDRCSNGDSIEALYSINEVYNGVATLVKESASLRPLLMATALLEGVSNKFQHSALLLSGLTDALCELIHELDQIDDVDLSAAGPMEEVELFTSRADRQATRPSKRQRGCSESVRERE